MSLDSILRYEQERREDFIRRSNNEITTNYFMLKYCLDRDTTANIFRLYRKELKEYTYYNHLTTCYK